MTIQLTEDQVIKIYQAFLYGASRQTLADRFGVSRAVIADVVSGRKWGYVTGLKASPTIEELANGRPFAPIPGFPDNYITTDGVVITLHHGHGRGDAFIRKPTPDADGYLCITYGEGKHRRTISIHRLLCLTFKADSWFEGAEVRHLDGNRTNNNLDNLKWGTDQEQYADMVLHGTSNRGERQWQSKLTEANVQQIRAMLKAGLSYTEIAPYFHVTDGNIRSIDNGKSWAWLPFTSPPADSLATFIAKSKPWKIISNTRSRPIQSSHVTVVVTRNQSVRSFNRW